MEYHIKIPLIILGAGGLAKELFHQLMVSESQIYEVSGFYSDRSGPNAPTTIHGVPVYHLLEKKFRYTHFVAALGDPKVRQVLVERALDAGMVPCLPLIMEGARVYGSHIGAGSMIFANTVISHGTEVGEHCLMNFNATLGHDCFVEDFVTLGPGSNVSGNCQIGAFTYVGTNACVKPETKIGKRAVVGMGSVVVRDVADDTTVISQIAKPVWVKPVEGEIPTP